jgi:hypothetical protein
MIPTEVKIGHVFSYAYLWERESQEGREEGGKDRPCLVLAIVALDEEGSRIVRVLPITHAPPLNPKDAIEIPTRVKQRLRLDDERSWIILTESNRFVWPGPDMRAPPSESADGYYGPLPPALFDTVKRAFVALARSGGHVSVPRSE